MLPPTLPGAAFFQRQWQRMLQHAPRNHSAWSRYAVALVLTLVAAWLRLQIGPVESGGRFITFALAAALSGLYGGFGAGMFSVLLGMVLINFLLIPPYFSLVFKNPLEAFWLNALHAVTQLVVVGAIALMQQRNRQQKSYADQLQAANQRLDDTFEQTASGIAHSRVDGSWIRINRTYCRLVGYSREEMEHLTFRDFTHPEDLDADLALFRRTLAGEITHFDMDKRYIHKDGHTVWVHLNLSLTRKPDGSPDYLIAVVQDIGVRKAAETALRTNERLMRQAQELAGMFSWHGDVSGNTFFKLTGSQRFLKLTSEKATGMDVLEAIHPDDRDQMMAGWIQAIKSKGKINFQQEFRAIIEGQERWITAKAEFERDDEGVAHHAYGVAQDITERKQARLEIERLNALLERRIQERTARLKSAYKELESYSYAVAHDLRSPLRVINGFSMALLEDNPSLDAASQIHLNRIMGASKKMGELIDGLLTLSQYARGDVKREAVNLSEMAEHILEELALADPQREVQWVVAPDLRTMADPALLRAVLQNLLHNAWKYTAATQAARIRVYSEIKENRTHFCVSDNGAGFDMKQAQKLFQPFQRLHMPNEFVGLGIGLATAQRIVLRHGGTLQGVGVVGEGATFCFTLSEEPGVDSGWPT